MASGNLPACSREKPARKRGRLSVGCNSAAWRNASAAAAGSLSISTRPRFKYAAAIFGSSAIARENSLFASSGAFQSRIGISQLEMRVGLVRALRNVFLKRIERRGEIHFVDRVIRLLQQRRERVFLFLRRRGCRRFRGSFPLGLRGRRNSRCGDPCGRQSNSKPARREIVPGIHALHLFRATAGGAP